MIINASAVGMGAKRDYAKTEIKTASSRLYRTDLSKNGKENNGVSSSISDQGKALAEQRKQLLKRLEDEAKQRNTQAAQNAGAAGEVSSEDEATLETLKRLLEMLKRMREMLKEGKLPTTELLDLTTMKKKPAQAQPQGNKGPTLTAGGTPAVPNSTVWVQETNVSSFVAESESVNFAAAGVVKTADGREIGFNVELEMSREFMEYAEMTELTQVKKVMTDPLVINLDTMSATVSDQKFRFDLNADGVEDEISYLNSGSGFLALDKNGDGKINDGSELFGAKTGNGFAELAAYDKDGNGWIDEADDIYDKLVVWVKTADGTDKQLSLKEANVGAIHLGSVSTDYSLTDSTADKADAQIRRTGVFLKETGQAGTIQHVDFSI